MTVKQLVERDLKEAIRQGYVKTERDAEHFVSERTTYHRSMQNMDKKGGRLAILDFLHQLFTSPLGILDFIVFHPIKTILALLQIAFIVAVILLVLFFKDGGTIRDLFELFSKSTVKEVL